MTRPTLADFELVLGPQTAREIAANAFAMSLAPSIEQRRERAAANLRAAGIDPDDRAAVRMAYEDALFDACAKKTHGLAAKDDQIAELERKLDQGLEFAESLEADAMSKDARIAELERWHSERRDECENQLEKLRQMQSELRHAQREDFDARQRLAELERKLADYQDAADLDDRMAARQQRILGDLDNALARMVGEVANAQEMVRVLICDDSADEELDAWQPYTHGQQLMEGDYWLRLTGGKVSAVPLSWYVDDDHGEWQYIDVKGEYMDGFEGPENIVAVLPVRRPTVDAPTEEPAPDLRPVPLWCSLTLTRDELDRILALSDMSGKNWLVAQRAAPYLAAWPLWEIRDREQERVALTIVGQPDLVMGRYQYRPHRLPGQREDGTIPASAMTPAHFERVAKWQWRHHVWCPDWTRVEKSPLGHDDRFEEEVDPGDRFEEWRPAIWAELDAQIDTPDAAQNQPADEDWIAELAARKPESEGDGWVETGPPQLVSELMTSADPTIEPDAIQTQSPASWQIPCPCGCPGSVAVADIQTGDRDVRRPDMIEHAFRSYRKSYTREGDRLFEHRLGDIHGPDTRALEQLGRLHWMAPFVEDKPALAALDDALANALDMMRPGYPYPPTFAAQVRAHAKRAGYEWREYTEDPRWLVAKDKQWILCCVHGAADPIRGRVGTAWVQMSEESALRFAESWPSTPNHTACELVQEWEVEPPDPGDSALEEHLAEQELIERYTMTARALANRWYLASQAIDAIAVLLGLGDWDDPQAVVEAVRERVGQWVEGPPQETGEYWLVIRFHDGSVSVDPSPHHITKLPLQPDGVDVVAHTPVSRPRYP